MQRGMRCKRLIWLIIYNSSHSKKYRNRVDQQGMARTV